MYRFIAASLAAASCAAIAQAQTAPLVAHGDTLTLDQAVSAAKQASPALDAAVAGVRAAGEGRIIAGLRPNPVLQAEVENVAGTGAYRGLSGAETTISVALPIELGGKRPARIDVANARSARARLGTAIAHADLELAVTQAYVAAVAAERVRAIARDRLDIAAEGLRVATDRVQVGATSPIDQQRAELQAVNARTALDAAERGSAVGRANLGSLIGAPVTVPLDLGWFDRVAAPRSVAAVPVEETLAFAAATGDLAVASAQVRLARSQRIPDLSISAGARRFEASGDVAAVFGVSIPLPLFNNGRASLSQANAERDQIAAVRQMAIRDARQAIAIAEMEVENAAAAARAAGGPALAAAEETARIARIGYGQGKFGQLDLLDAERTLAETRAAWVAALTSYHDAQARLRRLTTPAPTDTQTFGDDR